MRVLRLLVLGMVACAAGCAPGPTRPVEFPGRNYQTVFNATVASVCETKRMFAYQLDAEHGIIDVMMHAGGLGGHPRFQVLVSKGGRAPFPEPTLGNKRIPWIAAASTFPGGESPTVLILMPSNWRGSKDLFESIRLKVASGAPSPAPAALHPGQASSTSAGDSGAPATPASKRPLL